MEKEGKEGAGRMATNSSPVLARVASFTNGNTYEIRRGRDGRRYCTCPAWSFSKGPEKSCKHLRLFQETPRWQKAA